jgi:putative isomerase
MLSFFHESALTPFQVAYSRYGSYLSVVWRRERLYVQSMYGGRWNDGEELFALDVIDSIGNVLPFSIESRPEQLILTSAGGSVALCAAGKDDLLLRGQGVGLRLTRDTAARMFDYIYAPDARHWESNLFDAAIKAGLRAQRGTLRVDAPWGRIHSAHIAADFLPDEAGVFEGQLHLYNSVWQLTARVPFDFEAAVATNARDFAVWLAATLPVPERWRKGRETAALVNWSSVVAPNGLLQTDTMLMSKDLMNRVWSWDHCFNALALARQDAALAWEQFALFFAHQDADGVLPDFLADSLCSFAFCKPPIHGWTLRQLMQTPEVVTDARLREVYAPLVRWTDWWFTYRCPDDGLPQYHHGNDSGWDNGTATADGLPIISPDLAACLVIQMDVLAEIAARLGKPDEAATWSARADGVLARLIAQLWTGERFVAKGARTGAVVSGDSALMLVPLMLGKRLPAPIRDGLVAEVRRFMTAYGIPSEHTTSSYYETDGYWSGAIWAPVTYQIVVGLLACDERDLALDLSRRFCEMANRSGMAENFNALTGDGLKDSAYTWTASVFLLLGNLILQEELS